MNNKEIEKRNKLKQNKPYVYEKILNFDKMIKQNKSIAIIQLQYNYICNFNCSHCSIKPVFNPMRRELTLEDVASISQQADKLGLARFVITGGEPLIFNDFKELVKAINPNKFYISCDTNAYFLDEEKCLMAKDIGIDRFQISIDSLVTKEHDNFRNKKGSFMRCIKAVDICQKYDMDLFIQTVVTKRRLYSDEFICFLEYFNKRNIDVFVTFAKPVGNFAKYDELINEDDLLFFKSLEKKHSVFNHMSDSYDKKGGCIAIKKMVSITQHGDVQPCPYMHTKIGNIFENSLEEILIKGMNTNFIEKNIKTCPIAMDKDFIKNLDRQFL